MRANATQQQSDERDLLRWGYFDNNGIRHDAAKMVGGSGAHNGMMSYRGLRVAHLRDLYRRLPRPCELHSAALRSSGRVDFRRVGQSLHADSVTYTDTRTDDRHTVTGDVIVGACGVIGSPALLLRSNIGPASVAGSTNPHVPLGAVGEHYNAHPFATVGVMFNQSVYARWGYEVPITLQRDYHNPNRALSMGVFNYNRPDLGAAILDWGAGFKQRVRDHRKWQFGFSWPIFPTSRGQVTLNPEKDNSAEVFYPSIDRP